MTTPQPGRLDGMINPNIHGSKQISDYRFAKGFPTRENCDLNDPREMFLWMLVALPGMNGGQLGFPVSYNMIISEHLYECGARLVAEPVKKWKAPEANDPHWMTSPGRWVATTEPDATPDPAGQALAALSAIQKAEIFERLKRMRDSGDF